MDVWKYEIISRYLFVQPSPGQYNHLQSISGINKFRALLSWTCSVCTFSLSSFPGCMFLLVDLQLLLDCQKKWWSVGLSQLLGARVILALASCMDLWTNSNTEFYISRYFSQRGCYTSLLYTREHRKPSDGWRGNMLSNTFIFYGVRLIQENFQPG